jgi:hypothetical protein
MPEISPRLCPTITVGWKPYVSRIRYRPIDVA